MTRLPRTDLRILWIIRQSATPPTHQEIAIQLGWTPSSRGEICEIIKKLRRLGLVSTDGRKNRTLRPTFTVERITDLCGD